MKLYKMDMSHKVSWVAALNGDLQKLKWLRENGEIFDEQTFFYAAEKGNLDNMKWLREIGCP